MVLWDNFQSCHNVALDFVEIEFFSKRIFNWLSMLETLSYLFNSSIIIIIISVVSKNKGNIEKKVFWY